MCKGNPYSRCTRIHDQSLLLLHCGDSRVRIYKAVHSYRHPMLSAESNSRPLYVVGGVADSDLSLIVGFFVERGHRFAELGFVAFVVSVKFVGHRLNFKGETFKTPSVCPALYLLIKIPFYQRCNQSMTATYRLSIGNLHAFTKK